MDLRFNRASGHLVTHRDHIHPDQDGDHARKRYHNQSGDQPLRTSDNWLDSLDSLAHTADFGIPKRALRLEAAANTRSHCWP